MRGPHLSRLKSLRAGFLALAITLTYAIAAGDDSHPLRGDAAITETAPAPPLARTENTDQRQLRNYPEQPPTIPHAIVGYEISLRGNKCLSCHSRRRSVETGAPMISVSHFMDRDLQVLSDISTRRYFCTQCHVAQTTVAPPVRNEFIDSAELPEQ